MKPPSQSISDVRKAERKLLYCAFRFVVRNVFKGPVRRTRHFREWFQIPMSYARIMEIPLTLLLLRATKKEKILDVSSPKLLAMYYALKGYDGLVASDLENYFINDFEAYKKYAKVSLSTAVFDATRRIPFPDDHFDKIFSVSVLEHIPYDGDVLALRELLRVTKPTGSLVITLPAFTHYVEEWTSSEHYWKSVQDEKGNIFFQRRYDQKTLLRNFAIPGAQIEDIILIAEKPIDQPRIDKTGRMLHNCHYIEKVRIPHLLKMLSRHLKYLPFLGYLAEYIVSKKCHYMTTDWEDPNIRQVVVKITKATDLERDNAATSPGRNIQR